ncbi:response regulator [Fulvivirgaceae bacterium BMA10]|uniref:Response regulator n=1 Tax=Splendidivirga corallicola TaxID=3051826 RepID=A0ABT8KW25_9BACT|nr:response regulator [Fulvivirgaceae bacterium BMA10]
MGKVRKVLIVDDDEICTMISKKILTLTNRHLDINTCVNGKEAINYLAHKMSRIFELPDIILLDINMPIMNGWEFIETYKKLLPNLKKRPFVWMLSSTMWPEELERVKACSVLSGFISKPLRCENVLELLNFN